VLATSDDWNRLVYNKQAAMRALSSLRAWRRLKQSSLLQAARKPASAHKDADSPAPDHIDARLCPYTSFIPGVAPTSTPVSQRRAFWASIVLQVLVGPCVCYGLLKSRALPLGPSGVGLLLVVSAPSFQWLSFSLWGAAHHGPFSCRFSWFPWGIGVSIAAPAGNTVLLSLLECGSYAVTPFIASLTMALQLRFDADYAGVRVAPLVLVTFTLVSVPFIAALVFGSLCMVRLLHCVWLQDGVHCSLFTGLSEANTIHDPSHVCGVFASTRYSSIVVVRDCSARAFGSIHVQRCVA
jgi:hypothetical protein